MTLDALHPFVFFNLFEFGGVMWTLVGMTTPLSASWS